MQQRFAAFTPEPSSRSARPDLLYNLVVNTNVAVIENGVQREREYILSLGVIGAEWRRFRALPASIEALRFGGSDVSRKRTERSTRWARKSSQESVGPSISAEDGFANSSAANSLHRQRLRPTTMGICDWAEA